MSPSLRASLHTRRWMANCPFFLAIGVILNLAVTWGAAAIYAIYSERFPEDIPPADIAAWGGNADFSLPSWMPLPTEPRAPNGRHATVLASPRSITANTRGQSFSSNTGSGGNMRM